MSIHTTGLGAPVVGLEVGGASQGANRMTRESNGGAEFQKRAVFTFQPANHVSSWIDKLNILKLELSPFPVIAANEGLQGSPTKNVITNPGGDYYWEGGQPNQNYVELKINNHYGAGVKSQVTSTIFIQKCLLRYPPPC